MRSIVQRVKMMSGISPDNFEDGELDKEAEMEEYIEIYIQSVEDWLSTYLKRPVSKFPDALDQLIVEITSQVIRVQRIRNAGIIQDDADDNKWYIEKVITEDMKFRLAPFVKKGYKFIRM